MTELPIERILLEGIAEIERLGIPYAVMGGFAARAWGLPRPTYDADIAVAVDDDGRARLLDALEAAGFDVPTEHQRGFLDSVGGFQKIKVNRYADGHVWSTDIFVAGEGLLTSALQRARSMTIAGVAVRVMAPEDIILLKLIANRRKDLADIEELVVMCRDLDRRYLREWAARLSITDRLSQFLRDV